MAKSKSGLRQSDVNKVRAKLMRMESVLILDFNQGTTKQISERASSELQNNISTQKFASDYPSLNKNYAKWKRESGLGSKFWIRFGELFSAITRWKQTGIMNSWIAGIPAGLRNAQGDEIAEYAKANEFGIKPIKKRALFVPTAKEIDPAPTADNPVQGWAHIAWVNSVSRIIKTIWR